MDAQKAMDLYTKELMTYNPHSSDHDMFYYRLPYVRNYDLTNSIPIAAESGNIIKFYQYRLDKPVIVFTDVVDTTAEEIDDVADEYDEEFAEGDEGYYDENGEPRELSEDEMAALLTEDQGEEAYDKPPAGAMAGDEEVYDKEPTVVQGDGSEEAWEAPEF